MSAVTLNIACGDAAKEFLMKKVVLIVLAMVVIGSCAAQSASNDAQRIVGTWNDNVGGDTWVFSANGNLSVGSYNLKFGATNTQLAVIDSERGNFTLYSFSMSSDGKTLILQGIAGSDRGEVLWLTKK